MKLFSAYNEATKHIGQPSVILAKTVKGWALGKGFEARNMTHQKNHWKNLTGHILEIC